MVSQIKDTSDTDTLGTSVTKEARIQINSFSHLSEYNYLITSLEDRTITVEEIPEAHKRVCALYSETLDYLTIRSKYSYPHQSTDAEVAEVYYIYNLLLKSHKIVQTTEEDIDLKFRNKYRLANVMAKHSIYWNYSASLMGFTGTGFESLKSHLDFVRTMSFVVYNLIPRENAYLWVKYLKAKAINSSF